MNIDRFCDEPCCSDEAVSTATPAGIQLVREALDLLGRPDIVDYTGIADAFTRKNEGGEPCHTEGFQQYLDLGTDITCLCVLPPFCSSLARPKVRPAMCARPRDEYPRHAIGPRTGARRRRCRYGRGRAPHRGIRVHGGREAAGSPLKPMWRFRCCIGNRLRSYPTCAEWA
jgi:hypothetical protein